MVGRYRGRAALGRRILDRAAAAEEGSRAWRDLGTPEFKRELEAMAARFRRGGVEGDWVERGLGL